MFASCSTLMSKQSRTDCAAVLSLVYTTSQKFGHAFLFLVFHNPRLFLTQEFNIILFCIIIIVAAFALMTAFRKNRSRSVSRKSD